MEPMSDSGGNKAAAPALFLNKSDIDSDSMSDNETTIDSYIEKSPITNKFRIENPNLQPISTRSDNRTTALSSEDDTPIFGSNSYHSASHGSISTSHGSINPLHSHRRAASHAQTIPLPPPSPPRDTDSQLSRTSTATSISSRSFKDSFKRISLPNSFTNATGDMKRSISRLSLSRPGSSSYKADTKPTVSENPRVLSPFWKYHILKFGKNLFLTTNPGLKHIYCRNGPGYYVEVQQTKAGKNLKDGFSLVFRDIHSVETNKQANDIPTIMIITKKSKAEGGYLTISVPRHSKLQNDVVRYIHSDDLTQAPVFNGLSIPKKIDPKYIPSDQTGSNRRLEDTFRSYEFKDFNNIRWNIGSIPRVRVSKLNLMRSKLKDEKDEQTHLKFIGKRNIYFHQNFVEKESGLYPKYSVNTDDPKKVYLQESESNYSFPPVLALFKPHESKTGKMIMKSINRTFQTNSPPQISELNSYQQPSKINHKSLDHDIGAGGDIKNYYQAGDGLYYQRNPSDDTPNENKLGWITVYEDKKIFSSRGMFDIVVGLTLAVGFESCLE